MAAAEQMKLKTTKNTKEKLKNYHYSFGSG